MPLINFANKIVIVTEFVLRPIKNALRQVYFKEVVILGFFQLSKVGARGWVLCL